MPSRRRAGSSSDSRKPNDHEEWASIPYENEKSPTNFVKRHLMKMKTTTAVLPLAPCTKTMKTTTRHSTQGVTPEETENDKDITTTAESANTRTCTRTSDAQPSVASKYRDRVHRPRPRNRRGSGLKQQGRGYLKVQFLGRCPVLHLHWEGLSALAYWS